MTATIVRCFASVASALLISALVAARILGVTGSVDP